MDPYTSGSIRLTVTGAAKQFNVSQLTATRRLTKAGHRPGKGEKFDLATIAAALYGGDLEQERIRKTREETELLALRRLREEGELVPLASAEDAIRQWAATIRQRLLALPAAMALRCNPSDAEHARVALSEWVASAMRGIQADLAIADPRAGDGEGKVSIRGRRQGHISKAKKKSPGEAKGGRLTRTATKRKASKRARLN